MARVQLPESRVRARRKRRRLVALSVLAALVLLTVGLLVWVSWAPFLRVTAIAVTGQRTLASSTIAAVAEKRLSGAYAYVFARNNVFLYPKNEIAAAVLSELPAVADVSVKVKDFHTVEVTVTEREAKALWCGVSPSASVACEFIDADGVVFGASDFSGSAYVRYYGALTGSTTQQFLNPTQTRSLFALIDTLAQHVPDDSVSYVYVDPSHDARLLFESGFSILFSSLDPGGDVFERFGLALKAEPFLSHKLSDFQYLDLRFGDKLYYKLK